MITIIVYCEDYAFQCLLVRERRVVRLLIEGLAASRDKEAV